MTAKHIPGDQVYSIHGEAGRYIARAANGYLVEPIYESDDNDGPAYADPVTWREVFTKPPVQKLQADVAKMEARLREVTDQVRTIESTRRAFESEEKKRMERIQRHEQLAELDRYLAGELTHYVAVHAYYPSVTVIPVGETIESYSNNNGYGVLTLCPTRGWDKKVFWTVTYKVPSPSYSRTDIVIPCCGEEAANLKAAEWLRGCLEKYQAMEPEKRSYADQLVVSCQKFGVEVPHWLVDGIAATKRATLENSIATHRKNLTEAELALAAITRAAANIGRSLSRATGASES